MFQVQHTIISDDIATYRFACDIHRCKGACCVIGEAGASVSTNEIPVLNKMWRILRKEARPRAQEVVKSGGLVINQSRTSELNCTDGEECVFVVYDEKNIARCLIQKAWMDGITDWMKPLSCHLFPVRVMKVGDIEYLNVEYVPSLCHTACAEGANKGIYLSDFLKQAFIRAYGADWYQEFCIACGEVRKKNEVMS